MQISYVDGFTLWMEDKLGTTQAHIHCIALPCNV